MAENVIIIGSGPAGLSAAVYTAREGFSPLVISGTVEGGQLLLTTNVENYPGFPDGIDGPELIDMMRKQAERQGARFVHENATDLDLMARPFRVSAGGKTYETETLIIATGADSVWLGIESEKKFIGKGMILFGAYVMGKAQEIIKILNEIGVVPVVNKKISEISKVYKEYGVNLEYTSMYDNPEECEESLKGNFVGITDNASMRRIPLQLSRVHEKKVYTAVATGFSKIFRFYTDAQFCISDHADVKQSMDYINASGAKRVLTYGRGKEKLARVMQRNGLVAGTFA